MSIAALAVRIATIKALKGRTYAGDHVFDSKINPVNLLSKDNNAPVVIVTTDDDVAEVIGKDVRGGSHKLELVIEVAVTQKVTIETGEGEETEQLTIPATDAGLEASVGLLGWQIARELSADGGVWGDIWRRLVTNVLSIQSRRGADDENGARYAARQYIYVVDHVDEPTPGEAFAENSVWRLLIDTMLADSELKHLARMIETEVTKGDFMPWEIARGELGLANDVSEIIGNKPFGIEEEVSLSGVVVNGREINAASAEDADGPEKT